MTHDRNMKLRCTIVAGALLLLPPAAFAQRAAGHGSRAMGAALCVAAGERLANPPGADARIRDGVLAWRQILHVMDATEDRRQAVLDSARASLAQVDSIGGGMRKTPTEVLWSVTCADRDKQLAYINVHASEERTRNHLAEEPGTELGAEAVRDLNASVGCLVAAELFSSRSPARPLGRALRDAVPRAPDGGVLQETQARSRREIDAAPGSAAGKALVVDYLRYLFKTASSGSDSQPFVNRASQHLQNECQPGAGNREPAP